MLVEKSKSLVYLEKAANRHTSRQKISFFLLVSTMGMCRISDSTTKVLGIKV